MVEWLVNGLVITLRREGQEYIVDGPSGRAGGRNLEAALGRVRELLHPILAGSPGLTGWSLEVRFPGIRARYGDALVGGTQGGGAKSDVVACADQIYEPRVRAHQAVENSIEIVRRCWAANA